MPERIKVSALAILIAGIATLIFSTAVIIPMTSGYGSMWGVEYWAFFVFIIATPVIIGSLFSFGLSKDKVARDKELVFIGILLWAVSTGITISILAYLWQVSYG